MESGPGMRGAARRLVAGTKHPDVSGDPGIPCERPQEIGTSQGEGEKSKPKEDRRERMDVWQERIDGMGG